MSPIRKFSVINNLRMGCSGSTAARETKTASSALWRRRNGRWMSSRHYFSYSFIKPTSLFFKGVEPISEWKSPDSVQMSLVSYFFKLSMVLRNVHTVLTEDYQVSAVCSCVKVSQDLLFQLPYWVSYVAFAVATVLLGGLLGLFLVIPLIILPWLAPQCGLFDPRSAA